MAVKGRPRARPEQYQRASDLYFSGTTSARDVWTYLCDEFPDAVAERSVARWVQEFRETQKGELDAPFRWHELDKYRQQGYGVTWDTSPSMLEKWVFFQEHLRDIQHPAPLSVRQMRWWLHVHIAAPDVGLDDSFWMAQRFVGREQMHDVLDLPLYMDDLDAHLAYKPWESTEKREVYLHAVEEGRIPRRPGVEPLYQLARLKRGGLGDMRPVGMAMTAAGVPDVFPELLASQQFRALGHLAAGMSEEEALQMAVEEIASTDLEQDNRRPVALNPPHREE